MIRRANLNDSERLLELLLQVHAVHAEGRPDIFKVGARKFNEEQVKELILSTDKPIFVYDDDGVKAYAFVEWNIWDGNDSKCKRKELYIEDLCVEKKYRRQGIATKLFKYCEDLAKKEECTALTLNVWNLNEDAYKFYQAMGMNPLRTIMEKRL